MAGVEVLPDSCGARGAAAGEEKEGRERRVSERMVLAGKRSEVEGRLT